MTCPLISPNSLKADEEDRNSDRAPLVAVTENEVACDGDGRDKPLGG